ncbi:MAG: alpha,2-mannosyltransferase [Micromonosporaceae bacterium]|jgi:alpha-1,2-mannosyltransferase|nr:alpha,2-mannosyltransferase [Micromonosporaceae bacterium]
MASTRAGGARAGGRRYLVLAVAWAAAIGLHVWYGNRHHFFDLGIYYRAVRWWAHGHDIYSYSQPDKVEGSLGFTYPPFAAVLLRPLAYLSLGGAQAVFQTVSVAMMVMVVWLLIRPAAGRLGYPTGFAVALALPFLSWLEPVRETFSFGQINFIVVGLVVVDLLVAMPRGSRLAGVGIGLATAIKLTPAIFIVYLLLTRRWRAAATATATAAAATLLTAAASWNDSWRFWTRLLWETDRVGRVDRVQNQSLTGVLARLARPDDPNTLAWALLAALIVGYGLWRARSAALAGDEVTGLTLTALVGCAVSPVTWTHHLVWFVPAVIVLVEAAGDRHVPLGRRRSLGVLAALLYGSVAFSVVAWYDWHIVVRSRVDKGVPGFLIDSWYLILILVLLVALPIRRLPAGDAAGGREGRGSDPITSAAGASAGTVRSPG